MRIRDWSSDVCSSDLLDRDIAAADAAQAIVFTDADLAVYGIYELQELEQVLRAGDARTMREVADTIRAKIGRPVAEEDDVFLQSYYRQLKARLERRLLFGKRREDKYTSDSHHPPPLHPRSHATPAPGAALPHPPDQPETGRRPWRERV